MHDEMSKDLTTATNEETNILKGGHGEGLNPHPRGPFKMENRFFKIQKPATYKQYIKKIILLQSSFSLKTLRWD